VSRPYRIGFVIEDVLGHHTHGVNLRRHVESDASVQAHWAMLPFQVDGLAARVPVFRSNWTVRAGIRARRALRRLARATSLDVLFFHSQATATLSPDWVRRVPSVISLDATPQQYDELGAHYEHRQQPTAVERYKTRLARNRFRRARHLVTWSEWTKRGLVDGYGVAPEKVTVIPPGVDTASWAPPGPRAAGSTVRFLFVGAAFERKGGTVLLDAFRSLGDLDVELHVVTKDDVPGEPRLHVHHGLGPNSDELRALYHACDVFVLPTRGDCLPLVLCEAGAAALPMIATRVAGIPEIARDGDTGLLVPVDDPAALSTAMRRLATDADERERMSRRALEHARTGYDAAINTARLLHVLKAVADGRRPDGA